MEAAQIETRSTAVYEMPDGVDRSPIPPVAAASSFLAESGRAHDWFLDTLSELASDLAAEPGELSRVVSQQHRLLRQFMDAQRSILRYWAEVDAEVGDIVARRARTTGAQVDDRPLATHESAAETQLRLVLDDLWRAEHDAGRTLIDTTRSRDEHPSADAEPELADAAPADPEVLGEPAPAPALRELLDVFDEVTDDEEPVDVLAVIDRLLERLIVRAGDIDPAPPEPVLAAAAAPTTAPTAAPTIGDPDAFARFWGAGRSDDRGWRDRPFVQALMPLASGFVLLTGVLAWIG